MILLDTSALIDYLADGPAAERVEPLIAEGGAAVSAISVFELLAGVTNTKHIQRRRELLSLAEVIPVSADIADRAAILYTTLRQSGTTVDNEDLIIAATGLTLGIPIVTSNVRHFELIPGVVLK